MKITIAALIALFGFTNFTHAQSLVRTPIGACALLTGLARMRLEPDLKHTAYLVTQCSSASKSICEEARDQKETNKVLAGLICRGT